MAHSPRIGMHGRLRQSVHNAVRLHPSAGSPAHVKTAVVADEYLRLLFRSGRITDQQLESAIEAYRRNPGEFAWMEQFDGALLDKADHVFLVEYCEHPTEADDFRLNGNYHKICRSLEFDWHYYDEQLKRLRWDDAGHPHIIETQAEPLEDVRQVTMHKGNKAAFAIFIACGLLSVAGLLVLLLSDPSFAVPTEGYYLGVLWIVALCAGLFAARPRRTMRRLRTLRCGHCGADLPTREFLGTCPGCGAWLER